MLGEGGLIFGNVGTYHVATGRVSMTILPGQVSELPSLSPKLKEDFLDPEPSLTLWTLNPLGTYHAATGRVSMTILPGQVP